MTRFKNKIKKIIKKKNIKYTELIKLLTNTSITRKKIYKKTKKYIKIGNPGKTKKGEKIQIKKLHM
jgi:hypothetical protein|tara:strand:+ start:937 stop:1134 length:198 start_codon:yes stop_codon:yes gene_type:complete